MGGDGMLRVVVALFIAATAAHSPPSKTGDAPACDQAGCSPSSQPVPQGHAHGSAALLARQPGRQPAAQPRPLVARSLAAEHRAGRADAAHTAVLLAEAARVHRLRGGLAALSRARGTARARRAVERAAAGSVGQLEPAAELQAELEQVRAEVLALQGQERGLLSRFAQAAQELSSLYTQSKAEVAAAEHDMKIAEYVCSSLGACHDCVRAPVCGWCAVEARCVPGDGLGTFPGVPLQCSNYHFGTCDIAAA
mmetsp:Transcript_81463/g.253190  ORF Transcript_81463/g.253190 Transcript_81463/m.253190 type:complete len:252 (-) Transcript_81463:63-818(-)